MEKEQIVKALECCYLVGDCKECPYIPDGDSVCEARTLGKEALSLILEQDKQIEELTIELDAMRTAANSLEMHYENARADTAQKMHSMIKERCIKGGLWPAFIANVVAEVAKELSEGTSEISPPPDKPCELR